MEKIDIKTLINGEKEGKTFKYHFTKDEETFKKISEEGLKIQIG